MPQRKTKRGDERTPLSGSYDVLICGASFAGLAVARELAGSGADVLVVDRYEIGERQTSACGIPTTWLEAMGLEGSARQEFAELVVHTPHGTSRYDLPFSFSTFDYRELCRILWEQSDARFETAKVEGRTGDIVHTDRGDLTAPLIVDALGWKRILATNGYQPPDAPLSRGLEVHPEGGSEDLEIWIDRRYVPAGYGWSFPARDEQRIGVGSFDPRFHVKDTTVLLADDLERPAVRYQGNWIPHKLRGAVEDGIFFAGDSAGHCLPLTAEGIRTAFYFGIACGRELRDVYEGEKTKEQALADYSRFNDSHEWKFRWMLRVQKLVPRLPARVQRFVIRAIGNRRFVHWSFGHYLQIAPPEFAGTAPEPAREPELTAA
jgi:menaquinone-9 beta-reductase